jgi:hypothetical protein
MTAPAALNAFDKQHNNKFIEHLIDVTMVVNDFIKDDDHPTSQV